MSKAVLDAIAKREASKRPKPKATPKPKAEDGDSNPEG